MAEEFENIGVAVLSMTQGFAAFTLFMPKLSEVRAATSNDIKTVHDVRMGEIAATSVTLGIGAIISAATRSSGPIYIAAIVAGGFIALYETTLHKINPVEGGVSIPDTYEDTRDIKVNRNESGSLRTPFPFDDDIGYDVDRNLGTMGVKGYATGSEATVTTGEAGAPYAAG